jgi:thymidylate synthase
MMQKHSNNVLVLQKMGSHVWDEWISEGDPTIGKAYGYQYDNQRIAVPVKDISDKALTIIGSDALTALVHSYKNYPDHKLLLPQPEWALQQLCDNPSSREIMMNVYIPNDLPEMKLAPCAFGSHWEIRNGKLCTSVFIRSSDTMLGLPFNITQYATIQYMWAYLLKVPVGDLVVHLDDAHIYDRHIDRLTDPKDSFLERETFTAPKFWISKDVQSFQDFKYGENFCVIEYFYGKKMHFEVAIGRDELKELRKKQNNEKK